MRNLKMTMLAALAATVMAAPAATQQTVTLKITRVAQIDNVDHFEWLGADRADFYATVWIDGKRFQSDNFSHDDGRPNWTFSVPTSKRFVNIRVKLADDDGGLEERDDQIDINKNKNDKELNFVYDTKTGVIRGDIHGKRGETIYSYGRGDDDKGKIWLVVQ